MKRISTHALFPRESLIHVPEMYTFLHVSFNARGQLELHVLEDEQVSKTRLCRKVVVVPGVDGYRFELDSMKYLGSAVDHKREVYHVFVSRKLYDAAGREMDALSIASWNQPEERAQLTTPPKHACTRVQPGQECTYPACNCSFKTHE